MPRTMLAIPTCPINDKERIDHEAVMPAACSARRVTSARPGQLWLSQLFQACRHYPHHRCTPSLHCSPSDSWCRRTRPSAAAIRIVAHGAPPLSTSLLTRSSVPIHSDPPPSPQVHSTIASARPAHRPCCASTPILGSLHPLPPPAPNRLPAPRNPARKQFFPNSGRVLRRPVPPPLTHSGQPQPLLTSQLSS